MFLVPGSGRVFKGLYPVDGAEPLVLVRSEMEPQDDQERQSSPICNNIIVFLWNLKQIEFIRVKKYVSESRENGVREK